jgi:hypothetical protein
VVSDFASVARRNGDSRYVDDSADCGGPLPTSAESFAGLATERLDLPELPRFWSAARALHRSPMNGSPFQVDGAKYATASVRVPGTCTQARRGSGCVPHDALFPCGLGLHDRRPLRPLPSLPVRAIHWFLGSQRGRRVRDSPRGGGGVTGSMMASSERASLAAKWARYRLAASSAAANGRHPLRTTPGRRKPNQGTVSSSAPI